jgi:hypothetical protein
MYSFYFKRSLTEFTGCVDIRNDVDADQTRGRESQSALAHAGSPHTIAARTNQLFRSLTNNKCGRESQSALAHAGAPHTIAARTNHLFSSLTNEKRGRESQSALAHAGAPNTIAERTNQLFRA